MMFLNDGINLMRAWLYLSAEGITVWGIRTDRETSRSWRGDLEKPV